MFISSKNLRAPQPCLIWPKEPWPRRKDDLPPLAGRIQKPVGSSRHLMHGRRSSVWGTKPDPLALRCAIDALIGEPPDAGLPHLQHRAEPLCKQAMTFDTKAVARFEDRCDPRG